MYHTKRHTNAMLKDYLELKGNTPVKKETPLETILFLLIGISPIILYTFIIITIGA
jgi:hypothetical protein